MNKNWSDEELEASVKTYFEMKNLSDKGQKFTKKQFYEQLHKRYGRSLKSFEYRMQNISFVLSAMGREWVKGLRPAKHVGANVEKKLVKLIAKYDDYTIEPHVSFDLKVSKLRLKGLKKPAGIKTPANNHTSTRIFIRDPEVAAWALKNSRGICECCGSPSPFAKVDGNFYLEVHHLKRLADGGSDTITNTVAVCPNCHRELHYGENKEIILDGLYQSIDRLVKE